MYKILFVMTALRTLSFFLPQRVLRSPQQSFVTITMYKHDNVFSVYKGIFFICIIYKWGGFKIKYFSLVWPFLMEFKVVSLIAEKKQTLFIIKGTSSEELPIGIVLKLVPQNRRTRTFP